MAQDRGLCNDCDVTSIVTILKEDSIGGRENKKKRVFNVAEKKGG